MPSYDDWFFSTSPANQPEPTFTIAPGYSSSLSFVWEEDIKDVCEAAKELRAAQADDPDEEWAVWLVDGEIMDLYYQPAIVDEDGDVVQEEKHGARWRKEMSYCR